jgi:ribonucleoside-diphosphate reductase alpha chain
MQNKLTSSSLSTNYEPTGFSLQIFKDRYSFSPEEYWEKACHRVSQTMAACESNGKKDEWEEKFYKEISSNRFVPGGRIWAGAGRPKPNLINCFICDVEDSKDGWGSCCNDCVVISSSGGGIGVNYSKIRPRGSIIRGSGGIASGAVSFMKIINAIAEQIKTGGGRRSAHMMLLDICHPDIEEFLDAKLDKNQLNNANVSVSFGCMSPEDFFELVDKDKDVELVFHGQVIKKIKAKKIWSKIIDNAYENGEPGLFNHSFANKMNNTYYYKEIVGSNPCSEVVGQAFSSCVLGSIVLPRFVENGKINWDKLDYTIRVATRFLDNVVSVTTYPISKIEEEAIKSRKIGLGITGLHDALILCNIKYASNEAIEFVERVFDFIKNKAYETSTYLAVEKGVFQVFDQEKIMKSGFIKTLKNSVKMRIREYGLRNSNLLSCAPTGTISIISGNVSSGIEPIFGPAYKRKYYDKKDDDKMKEELVFHPLFDQFMREGKDVSHFENSDDIPLKFHFEIQKACQKHIDQSISKTIILDKEKHSKKEIEKLIREYLPFIKGTTIYPLGSRENQPISPLDLKTAKKLWLEMNEKKTDGQQSRDKCKDGTCEL